MEKWILVVLLTSGVAQAQNSGAVSYQCVNDQSGAGQTLPYVATESISFTSDTNATYSSTLTANGTTVPACRSQAPLSVKKNGNSWTLTGNLTCSEGPGGAVTLIFDESNKTIENVASGLIIPCTLTP